MSTRHAGIPGMRQAGQSVLTIMIAGSEGRASLVRLEASLGPCAHASADGLVWAVHEFGDYAKARCFAVPAELARGLEDGIHLAAGVTAKLNQTDSVDCTMEGPGAAFANATRGLPGYRQTAFPELPTQWAIGIASALGGRTLIAPIAPAQRVQPAPARPPATRAAAPGSTAKRSSTRNSAELARRSGIVAKYGVTTPKQRAIVNQKIADGSEP
jgi:hypothetical protein